MRWPEGKCAAARPNGQRSGRAGNPLVLKPGDRCFSYMGLRQSFCILSDQNSFGVKRWERREERTLSSRGKFEQ
jgi:hypothetical protein